MAAHARLSPSSADRWMVCPGSVAKSDKYPNEETEFAAEGTVFHALAEDALLFGVNPRQFIGQKRQQGEFEFEITEEMVEHLEPGLDRLADLGGKLYIETKVDLGHWLPGQFGTLDVGIIRPDEIVIFDWKYGQGVSVSPVDNTQLKIYALGFWENIAQHVTKATKFRIMIWQPRIPMGGGEWTTTLEELLAFGEEVRAAGVETYKENAPLVASEKGCYWCPAKNDCAAFAEYNLDLLGIHLDDLDALIEGGEDMPLPDDDSLTPEQRTYIIRHTKMITGWLDGLHARVLTDYQHGRPTPGMKAVSGRRPARAFTDVDTVVPIIKQYIDDPFTHKLMSPAQVEKVAGKRAMSELEEHIQQGDAKPVLVSEADPRPALPPIVDLLDHTD